MFSSIRENISPTVAAAAALLLIVGTLCLAGLAAACGGVRSATPSQPRRNEGAFGAVEQVPRSQLRRSTSRKQPPEL